MIGYPPLRRTKQTKPLRQLCASMAGTGVYYEQEHEAARCENGKTTEVHQTSEGKDRTCTTLVGCVGVVKPVVVLFFAVHLMRVLREVELRKSNVGC